MGLEQAFEAVIVAGAPSPLVRHGLRTAPGEELAGGGRQKLCSFFRTYLEECVMKGDTSWFPNIPGKLPRSGMHMCMYAYICIYT